MPYYRGDNYYRGDYYRGGDFLGIGSALKSVAKFAYNTIVPAPIRGVVSAVGNIVHPSLPPAKGTQLALAGQAPSSQFGLINVGGTGSQSGLLNIGGGAPPPAQLMAGGVPGLTRGMHLNKSTYETRGGGTSRWGGPGLQLHQKGTVLVKNRRMNVGNARALKKSLRRISGFARLARRVMTFTHPRAGRGRFKFAKRGKR